MPIELYTPLSFTHIGERDNNEDAIFPELEKSTDASRLFMVCDGMGGAAKGEMASRMAIEGFAHFFASYEYPIGIRAFGSEHDDLNTDHDQNFERSYIEDALDQVEENFDAYLGQNPEAKGMGTTLTLLYFDEAYGGASAIAAHVGDSRIFHVRNGKITWQSQDHKWVDEMVRQGTLTPEEALNHPKRNVITRAIQGKSVKNIRADVHEILDLKTDDYFLICSDGVLENLTNEAVEQILDQATTDEDKFKQIEEMCHGKTADNYSAYLVHIKKVERAYEADLANAENQQDFGKTASVRAVPRKIKQPIPKELIAVLLLALGAVGGWWAYNHWIKKDKNAIVKTATMAPPPKTK